MPALYPFLLLPLQITQKEQTRAAYTAHTYLDKCAGQRKGLIVRMRERPSDQRRDTWCRVRQARQQQPCTVTACAADMMKSTCAWTKECHRQKPTGRRDTLGGRGHLAGAATSCSHATFGCDQCNLSHPAAIQNTGPTLSPGQGIRCQVFPARGRVHSPKAGSQRRHHPRIEKHIFSTQRSQLPHDQALRPLVAASVRDAGPTTPHI